MFSRRLTGKKCVGQKNFPRLSRCLPEKRLLQIRPLFSCPHSTCRWFSVTNRAENICFITWRSRQFLLEWWPLLTCPRPYEKAPHMWSRYTIPLVPLSHSTLSALLLISRCHQISLFRPCLRSVPSLLYIYRRSLLHDCCCLPCLVCVSWRIGV